MSTINYVRLKGQSQKAYVLLVYEGQPWESQDYIKGTVLRDTYGCLQ